MFEIFLDFLKTQDVEYRVDINLSDMSPIKIGGRVGFLVYPKSVSAMINLLKFLEYHSFSYKITGRMTNILFARDSYDVVIIRTDCLSSYSVKDEILNAECGLLLASKVHQLASSGYGGLSELSGIPGSIGGLIRTGAGAFGVDISDVLLSIDVYDSFADRRYEIMRADIPFSYRNCPISSGLAILGAKIKLRAADIEKTKSEIFDFKRRRILTQPTAQSSLGSTFKRPPGDYAARLIDEAGFKGFSVGGASVSLKHAGFIINSGNATASDVLTLMDIIEKEIYSKYNVRLEPEIEVF